MAQSEIASSAARITRSPPPTTARRVRIEPLQQLRGDHRGDRADERRDESSGAMIAVGLIEPAAASTPIIVAGMSCTPEVLTAMNVTIALRGRVLVRVERLQLFHRLDAERRRGVVEAEHVRGEREHDRAGGRMVRAAPRETASAAAAAARGRASVTRPAASATRIMPSQSVMTPTRPIAISHRRLRRVDGAFRHRFRRAVERGDDQRDGHQAEPDVVEHGADYSRGVRPGSDRGQTGVRPGSDRGQTRVRPGSDPRRPPPVPGRDG